MQYRPEFFLVFSPTGPTPPKYQHSTYQSAYMEARRMSCVHPGQEFYVMRAETGCILPSQEPVTLYCGTRDKGNPDAAPL